MFANTDLEEVKERSTFFSLMFAAIGGVSFFTMFLQVHMNTHTHICIVTSWVCLLPSSHWLFNKLEASKVSTDTGIREMILLCACLKLSHSLHLIHYHLKKLHPGEPGFTCSHSYFNPCITLNTLLPWRVTCRHTQPLKMIFPGVLMASFCRVSVLESLERFSP